MRARSPGISLILIFVTILGGLAIRFGSLGLPYFFIKYGGSMLWALMIYWVISTLAGSRSISTSVMLSGAIATAIEIFKSYHSPAVDAFRLTLPGILLLGRFFSVRDIVAYWLAISVGATIDKRLRSAN